nr:fructosamine kinase family protein [Methylomarinum sp. Ch1-1]MDP4519636.1 fructosamine kinase family protein [Methylomarinum sp. Ch1-1]
MGSTAQHNERHKDWVEFWRAQRLLKQLQFAADNGHAGKLLSQGEKLAEKLDVFFETYQPQPALLHGDLWGAMPPPTVKDARSFTTLPAITATARPTSR